jgi:hypothetical protein
MTQPTQNSSPASPGDGQLLPEALVCQTPECYLPVAVITVTLDDGSTDQECMGCCMSRNLAILEELTKQGIINIPGPPA